MASASTVSFPCSKCGASLERAFPSSEPAAPCAKCSAPIVLHGDAFEKPNGDGVAALVRCPVCHGEMLYRQKDFRQSIGCLVVLVAAAIVPLHPPLTYASLVVAALIDFVLYRIAGEVVICHRIACRAHVRGLPAGPKVGPFDLSIHDYHRMLARREAQGLTGPDETTGPPLDSMSHRH